MTNVFVSHATADDDKVDRLYDALLAAGLEAFVDHKAIGPGDNWSQAIQDGLNVCDVGLFVLSPKSVKSAECEAEYRTILRLKKKLYVAFIEDVLPADFPWRLGTIQYSNLKRDFDRGVAELAAAINGKRALDPNAPTTGTLRRITGTLPLDIQKIPMSGRDNDVAEVLKKLERGTTLILGVGGLGKTRLVIAVAEMADVGGVVWHKASAVSSAEQVLELARQHFDLEATTSRKDTLDHLREQKMLVVIDNAESVPKDRHHDYASLVQHIEEAGGDVLMTSRNEWRELDKAQIHRPSALNLDNASKIADGMATQYGVDLHGRGRELAEAARLHPGLIEWAVLLSRKFPVQKVITDLKALRSANAQERLNEFIGKTVEQMVDAHGQQYRDC